MNDCLCFTPLTALLTVSDYEMYSCVKTEQSTFVSGAGYTSQTRWKRKCKLPVLVVVELILGY